MSQLRLAAMVSLFGLFLGLPFSLAAQTQAMPENVLVVRCDDGRETISRNIYGHFAEHLGGCVYGGLWVGEDSPIPNTRGIRNDVVAALQEIGIPLLRWPGGCFADEYHWRDGIGPRGERPKTVNRHWGMVPETNAFGTHEFMDLCQQIGAEPYLAGNLGSGTVQEMAEWVEYMNFAGDSSLSALRIANGRKEPWSVRFWGVGNESWGCGGSMTAEYYADEYRRFAEFLRHYSGTRLYKIACGASDADIHWTEVMMRRAGRQMDGLSLHHYTWSRGKTATDFDEAGWFSVLHSARGMDDIVRKHIEVMDRFDPECRVGLIVDEWGAWYDVDPGTNPGFLKQQNTLRDALLAGITLNVFHEHCGRVKMANLAQMVNVLQALILTEGDKMVVTPTGHVFEMYRSHQDATLLPTEMQCRDYVLGERRMPALSVSASRDKDGTITISCCNLDPRQPAPVVCELSGATATSVAGRILTAPEMNSHNTFDAPETLKPREFTGAKITPGGLRFTLPPRSVVVLRME